MIETLLHKTPLGEIVLGAKDDALVGLWFRGQKYEFGVWKEQRIENPDSVLLQEAAQWVDAYFEGRRPEPCALTLYPHGTPFCERVWKQLLCIPYGTTTTYGELARVLGMTGGAQAVGGAVGHNPISIIIPCHRVLAVDGSLTGYAGGLARKQALLRLERTTDEER